MKNYYVLSNGGSSAKTTPSTWKAPTARRSRIPVEDVDSLYLYGEVDLNTKLLNFLSQKQIPLHVFNYYGFYSGSYYPREYLHSGYLLVHQVGTTPIQRRMTLAREIVRGASHSLLRNVAYYSRRKGVRRSAEPVGEIGMDVPALGCAH